MQLPRLVRAWLHAHYCCECSAMPGTRIVVTAIPADAKVTMTGAIYYDASEDAKHQIKSPEAVAYAMGYQEDPP